MRRRLQWLVVLAAAIVLLGGVARSLRAQGRQGGAPQVLDRLAVMAPYQQFVKKQPLYQNAMVSGALNVTWAPTSASFTYAFGGKGYRFDVAEGTAVDTGDAPAEAGGGGRAGGRGAAGGGGGGGRGRGGAVELAEGAPNPCPPLRVERGRQAACVGSPDGKMRAFYKDRNLWIANADGSGERQITKDGDEKTRVKYGVGSWVYGEELGQTSAIWWSPDGRKVGFYRFDESHVKDFYLQMTQTEIQSSLDVEAYPKAGAPNPIADLFVYDVASGQTTKLDIRDGKPFTDIPADGSKFTNDIVGHYVYRVSWARDGSGDLMMNRANRRQNIMEFVRCSPSTAKCRVIVHEEWLTGWVANSPTTQWLADNKRFLWISERNGWRNIYLYDAVAGKLLNPVTATTTFEVVGIAKVDEAAGVVFYTARDGDNFMKTQLHRVGLDGRGDVRLTDPAFSHTVSISPDNKTFVDVYQTHDQPPATRVLNATGKVIAELAKSDMTRFSANGLRKVEFYKYKAADGVTDLWGSIGFPTDFDPSKKYPLLASVYGGPGSGVLTENFANPSATTEYGFLTVSVTSRSAPGQGKRMLDQVYQKLGVVEMDDMAAGIRALWSRPYVDKGRVGIYGTSYGGYTSALSILRHSDVWTAASASSPVTSWYHYDSIYTERYMWIPQENKDGYEAGNAMNFAKDLKGRLLLYYATADNNVHPHNSMQLIVALQRAGKSFELQVGPDLGHSGVNNQRMMEFFIENLILRPDRLIAGSR